MVSKRWWWTSSDGNDFANTFDIKLISVWLTCCGFINYLIIFAPGKGNVNPITFTTTPRKHEGYPTPSLGGGGGGRGRSFKGRLGRGVPRPRLATLPSV